MMLRKRLITVLTFVNGVLFRTKLFTPDYRYTLNFVDSWSVDEIVVLNVTRPGQGERDTFLRVIEKFAKECFVPLSVGGGIRALEDVKAYLDVGADKVVVNTGALQRPSLISDIARVYGTQCVVLSMDAKSSANGRYEVFSDFGSVPTGRMPADWAKEAEELGVGEIMVSSIDRDGSLQGYEIPLCRQVADAVSVPVLICGGAGNWGHFVAGIRDGGASGVCTTNIYHFTDSSIKSAKAFLREAGLPVRI
jgi:cyclase